MSLDAILRKINSLDIVLDMESVVDYVHKYAWQTCEWQGIDPKLAQDYRARLMIGEAYHVMNRLTYMKMVDKMQDVDFSVCISAVDEKVRREHSGGISLGRSNYDKS